MSRRNKELSDRVAIVIGGGSLGAGIGIGRAICLLYAREGAHVVVVDLEKDAAEATVFAIKEEEGNAEAVAINAVDETSVRNMVDDVYKRHNKIDILHCNVGIGKAGGSSETSLEEWRNACDTNLTSVHIAVQSVLPIMRAQESGVLLATSTLASIRYPSFQHLAYGATKAGVNQMMRLLAVENAPFGIRANSIIAGLIDTPRIRKTLSTAYDDKNFDKVLFARAQQPPLARMGSSWDIAEAALFLASDRASYITATELLVDGGLSATIRNPYFQAT